MFVGNGKVVVVVVGDGDLFVVVVVGVVGIGGYDGGVEDVDVGFEFGFELIFGGGEGKREEGEEGEEVVGELYFGGWGVVWFWSGGFVLRVGVESELMVVIIGGGRWGEDGVLYLFWLWFWMMREDCCF